MNIVLTVGDLVLPLCCKRCGFQERHVDRSPAVQADDDQCLAPVRRLVGPQVVARARAGAVVVAEREFVEVVLGKRHRDPDVLALAWGSGHARPYHRAGSRTSAAQE